MKHTQGNAGTAQVQIIEFHHTVSMDSKDLCMNLFRYLCKLNQSEWIYGNKRAVYKIE